MSFLYPPRAVFLGIDLYGSPQRQATTGIQLDNGAMSDLTEEELARRVTQLSCATAVVNLIQYAVVNHSGFSLVVGFTLAYCGWKGATRRDRCMIGVFTATSSALTFFWCCGLCCGLEVLLAGLFLPGLVQFASVVVLIANMYFGRKFWGACETHTVVVTAPLIATAPVPHQHQPC
mmetsp:Transcript_26812/g.59236  ORF Transcript_26812/g.59236 Transcript_26812/m.59236 type:complete len:176 (+) Transcript_26812:1306-1833(+)